MIFSAAFIIHILYNISCDIKSRRLVVVVGKKKQGIKVDSSVIKTLVCVFGRALNAPINAGPAHLSHGSVDMKPRRATLGLQRYSYSSGGSSRWVIAASLSLRFSFIH